MPVSNYNTLEAKPADRAALPHVISHRQVARAQATDVARLNAHENHQNCELQFPPARARPRPTNLIFGAA